MPAGTPSNVTVGPGTLYIAPLSSTEPTDLATAWPGAWTQIGYTQDGHEFNYNLDVQPIYVAEELEPIKYSTVKREISLVVSMAELTALNLKRIMNGGTITPSGGVNRFDPPALGNEVRAMVGWQSLDGLERWVFRQGLFGGQTKVARKKAPNFAALATTFNLEKPNNVQPFVAYIDGSRA